jgi:hypothetical protein
MKIENLFVEKNYDLLLDNDKVWEGENTNIFVTFLLFFKSDKISNLNDNLHLKELNLRVHVGFTCEVHQQ